MPATEPMTMPAIAPPDIVLGQTVAARGVSALSLVSVLVLVMGA